MDMVFVYEDKIAQDAEGNYYTGSAFSQEVFDRYLQHFDHITLLMRKANVDPRDTKTFSHMNKISDDRLEIVLLPDLNTDFKTHFDPRLRKEFRQTVRHQITKNRAVIIRAPSVSGTIAADYCHANSIPYLAEAVGCPWDSLWNHSLKGKVMAPWWWKSFRRTMRHADYAVYVTDAFLQRRYPTQGKTAAISDVELQPTDEGILIKRIEKIRNHKGPIKIATAASVSAAYKGQQFVIEALAKLKTSGVDSFEYHMAGGGDETVLRELAEKLGVSNLVLFEGSLSHDEMFGWLDEMDLYIQPSLQEGLPRAVVEAMSRAMPALGARTGGIPELLGEECIFPRKSINSIAKMLNELTPEQMIKMAENNFKQSKKFQGEILDKKRFDFYSAFAEEVRQSP